ncbi:hypothetical protein [Thermosyntropha sp.]|uniref:hypothetical protein n=1 Tax=Thermosyntropha sp. TaxID=2740820 RepID=UPI0025DC88E3|nr:hypothetical protein [Thermosyntropha sp.]MBO8159406.1 hypothetical protein [Thermosyntropha sp.]
MMVESFYKNILDKVLIIEKAKKDLSRQILLSKGGKKRLNFIRQFLQYEVDKHELFEHAAVVAINNKDAKVLKDISLLYMVDDEEKVLSVIRSEIGINRRFMENVKKVISYPQFASFTERRLVKEIEKYVIEKAKLYNSM